MCSGRSVCGKSVRSGSGKMGTSALATDGSADGRELESGDGVETLDDAAGQSQEGCGLGGGGLADHDGHARVTALARLHLEGDAREERHAELLGHAIATTFPEDGVLRSRVGGDEVAHVLHDAEDWHVELAEHGQCL